MSRTGRQLALAAALAALTTACIGGYPSGEGFSETIVLGDLNPKVLPIAVEVDANPKDTAYVPAARYKPATATMFGMSKDRRLLLRGKQDGAALRAVLERDFFATEYALHVRIAVDPAKTKGLVAEESLGFFELVLDTSLEGDPPVRRLEAVYDGSNGFTLQATDGVAPLGTPAAFAATSEVVLQLRYDGANLVMEGGPATGAFVTDFTPTVIHSELLTTEATLRQTVAWGARGLGKKGSLYVNQLTLAGVLPDIGAAETPIALVMQEAFLDGSTAMNFGDFATVAAAIENARAHLEDARDQIQAALDDTSFGPVTQGQRALKNAGKALKSATKGKAIADKQAGGAQKTKPIAKKARQALMSLQLAFAQLAGFRSNSSKRVTKTGFLPFGW